MKKHLSKRLLSLFLAVMMVVTSAPFVVSAAGNAGYNGDDIRYLFAYFTGDDSEEVRFAVSEDGFDFEALNGNYPILDSENVSGVYPEYAGSDVNDAYGKAYQPIQASGHARDPYIVADSDGSGYYVLATDLEARPQAYRNSKLLVWHIDDLGNASSVQPWNIETMMWFNNYVGSGYGGAGNAYPDFYAWAPGAIWDPDANMYLLYWTAGRSGDSRSIYKGNMNSNYDSFGIYGVYTPDFKTFYGDDAQTELTSADQAMLIYDPNDYATIDAEIVYNENDDRYYLWNKVETHLTSSDEKYLCYAVSDNITGPYTWEDNFIDNDYPDFMEGPFIYQLSDERYILMMDYYKDNSYANAEFLSYVATDPVNFMHNDISDIANINYLKPRHGKVCHITADEYEALVKNYGKVTYSGQNYFPDSEDSSINDDTLVARYFINDDLNKDNTGNGYDLTSANLQAGFDDIRTYAVFNGGGQSSAGTTGYAERSLSDMASNFNSKDGVTVSFYARNRSGNENRRFFEFTTFGRGGWNNNDQDGAYINFCADNRFEFQYGPMSNNNYAQYGGSSAYPDSWQLYTMTITESFIAVSVNGVLQETIAPAYNSNLTETVFDRIMNGQLVIGASSWNTDPTFAGDIYDFRIYNRALSNDEVQESLNELGDASYIGDVLEENDNTNRIFYDPMEDATIDGSQYTAYSNTYADGDMGNVMNLGGDATNAHYPFNSAASDNGYTLSFWYNPGGEISGTILNIGQYNSNSDSESNIANKKYFALDESGRLWYCYNNGDANNQSYGDIHNLFGSQGLALNTWQHIVIQIVPNGNYEILYTYIDGELVNMFESYKSVDGSGTNRTMKEDRTILDYFANAASINGTAASDDEKISVRYGVNYHNNYGSNTNGMIDDVTFYDHSYSASDIFRENSIAHADTLIHSAIERYESMMDAISYSETADGWNGTIYTNMAPAYAAYDKAIRYLDATDALKGGVTYNDEVNRANLAEYYVDLVSAMNDMQPYSDPQDIGGMTQEQSGVATPIDSAYTNNMLSAADISRPMEWKGGTMTGDDTYATDDAGQNMAIASASFVWMYTGKSGDTPTAPINAGVYCNDYNALVDYYGHYIYPVNPEISLTGNWVMNGSETVDWYYNGTNNGYMYSYADEGSHESTYHLGGGNLFGVAVPDHQDNGDWGYGSNVLQFNGDNNTFNDQYFVTISPQYNGCLHTTWRGGQQHNSPGNTDYSFWPQGDIYVINYSKVKDELFDSGRIAALKNIAAYTPDSVAPMLEAYDALTSTEYRFNTSSYDAVSAFADSLSGKVGDLTTAVAENPPVEKADDTAASDAITAETPDYEALAPTSEEYTKSSWDSYDNAYNALRNYYASLDPKGEDRSYTSNQDYLNNFVNNLQNSSDHLVKRADYSSVVADTAADTEYTMNYDAGNGTDLDSQKYTYGSWFPFKISYETAEDWADKPVGYKQNTPKYESRFVRYDGSGSASEARYPYIAVNINDDGSYSVVNNPDMINDTTIYMFYQTLGLDGFYENQYDENVSQFETGEWILFEGVWINLNGCRYAPSSVPVESDDSLSSFQASINDAHTTLVNTQLKEVADYDAYNAATELLKYQDVGAFTDDYLNSENGEESVYGLLRDEGTQEATAVYTNGADADGSISVDTKAWSEADGEKAYVKDADGKVWMNRSDQGQLDERTAKILTDLESVNSTDNGNRTKYRVTFTYYRPDGTEVRVYDDEYNYGEIYAAVVPDEFSVYKWVVTSNDTTMEIPAKQSYNAYITSNVTIVAYCSEETTEDQATVQIENQYGNLIQEYVVGRDVQITVDRNKYTIDGTEYRVEDTPFYVFDGWQVNGENYNNGSTFTVGDVADENGIVTLRMKFNVASGMFEVSMIGGTVTNAETGESVENTDTAPALYPYDTTVTVKPAESVYGIALEIGDMYYAVSYGDVEYTFYTVGNVKFLPIIQESDGSFTINGETVTDAQTVRKLQMQLPFGYTIGQQKGDKFTAYSATTANLPAGVEITEVGTLYTTSSEIAYGNSFVLGADGVSYIAAKNQLDTEQFLLRFNNGNTTVYTRTYIKYKYSSTVEDSDRDPAFSESTQLQTVDYGNVCASSGN